MGAVRSFWDNYHVLRPVNVHPTKELVKLAAPRQIPIHYISTIGVLPRDIPSVAGSAANNPPSADGAEGYVATRWASERILERSTESFGIPTSVHRPLPSTQQGTPQANLDDFVRFIDQLGIMPDMTGWEGTLAIAPANRIAVDLAAVLLSPSDGEESGTAARATKFAHYESLITVNVAEMREYLEKARGDRNLERMPGLKWIGKIKQAGWEYITF